MIPDLIPYPKTPWPILPPGIWEASMNEIKQRFTNGERRRSLFDGLEQGVLNLFNAGCGKIFIDGSYVTGKPIPDDYDLCWDAENVDPYMLDPVLLIFEDGRAAQKQKYLGEFFPVSFVEGASGMPFIEFFQVDKHSGGPKGIIMLKNYLTQGG